MARPFAGLAAAAAVAAALAVLALPGPPPPSPRPPVLPALPAAGLEAWLAAAESVHADLTAGTEKRIYRPAAAAQGEWALVYLHGFSATRRETYPLMPRVAERLGADLFETRLTGHGRGGAALGRATAADWLGDALEALAVGRRLGRRVAVVGVSTGGTLAAWLAARAEPGPDALVLISPNFRLRDPAARLLRLPGAAWWLPRLRGPERVWEPRSAVQGRYWTTRYPWPAVVEMAALLPLVEDAAEAIGAPVLVLYSPADAIVDAAATERFFARLAAPVKRLVEVEGSDDPDRHVLAGDILSPSTTVRVGDEIVSFLAALDR